MRNLAIAIAVWLSLGNPSAGQSVASGTPIPDAAGIYRAGKGVVGPKVISQAEPEYSEAARKKKIAGNCRMDIVVDASGRVSEVKVTHSVAEGQPAKLRRAAESLDIKAVEAVRKYRFEPGIVDGKPVSVQMMVEINFQTF